MAKFSERKSNKLVVKSNALARAHWKIESVLEPRLVALIASKVQPNDKDFSVYQISLSELWQLGFKKGGQQYEEIKKVVKNIMGRVIEIKTDDGWILYHVFRKCEFKAKESILEIGFDPELKPHYLQLKKNFVKYQLLEFMMLPSVYSQRLFEILKSWSDQLEVTITVKELHKMLDTSETSKKDFRQFRTRVLEKAHKDILENTSLTFEWEPIKTGRKVTAVRFILSKKLVQAMEEEKKKKERQKLQIKRNSLGKEAWECFQRIYTETGSCPKVKPKREVCVICQELKLKESK